MAIEVISVRAERMNDEFVFRSGLHHETERDQMEVESTHSLFKIFHDKFTALLPCNGRKQPESINIKEDHHVFASDVAHQPLMEGRIERTSTDRNRKPSE